MNAATATKRNDMSRIEQLLACLAEECAELQHAVAKAQRFGLVVKCPDAASTNAQNIAREFLDVLAVVEILEAGGAISLPPNKLARISQKNAPVVECLPASRRDNNEYRVATVAETRKGNRT